MKRLAAALIFVAVVVGALVLTVGGDDPDETAVPALTVTRIDDNSEYELAQLNSADKPTLLQVWEHYRIPGQPGAILLDTDGRERGRWLGAFDTNLAVEAAQGL